MTFTIPNSSQTYSAKQAQMDQGDFSIFGQGFNAFGLISGCLPTATTSSLVVSIASGIILSGGTKVSVSSGTVTLTSGDATNPRFDLLVVSTSGAISITAGTASSAPTFPAIATTSVVVIASVYVPAAATVTSSSQITDKRVLMAEWDANQPAGRWKNNSASTVYWTVPGSHVVSVLAALTFATSGIDLFPFSVVSTISVDQLGAEVTTISTSGGVMMMGIYRADTDWQPTALIVGTSEISTSSLGVKTFAPASPLVLPPGRYFTALSANNLTVQWGSMGFARTNQPFGDALGSTIFVSFVKVSQAYATPFTSGIKWTTAINQSTPTSHSVLLRVSTP